MPNDEAVCVMHKTWILYDVTIDHDAADVGFLPIPNGAGQPAIVSPSVQRVRVAPAVVIIVGAERLATALDTRSGTLGMGTPWTCQGSMHATATPLLV